MSLTLYDPKLASVLDADPRREARAAYWIIALFFGGVLGWAAFLPLSAAVVGSGVVKVAGNRVTVQHRDGGAISKLLVAEGERVRAGDVLLQLSAPEVAAQEAGLTAQLLDLEANRERLLAEIRGSRSVREPASWSQLSPAQAALADEAISRQRDQARTRASSHVARIDSLRQRQTELEARISGLQEEMVALERQKRLVSEEVSNLNTLTGQGFAPVNRLRAMERSEAEVQARYAEVQGSLAQTRESVHQTEFEIRQLEEERRATVSEELSTVEARLREIRPQVEAMRVRLERSQVRAPTEGLVVGLAFHNEGAVVQPGERIMDIVPDQRELVVEAKIRTADADNVQSGQRAEVMFRSFGSRSQSRAWGEVRLISADRFEDEYSRTDYFLVEVAVPPEELERLAKANGQQQLQLRAGLPADIVVPMRGRTALEYLTDPLRASVWRSFREE